MEEIYCCQESRPMVSREFFPKNKALADAILWRLCIMSSILSETVMAWWSTFSKSLSDHPPPFSDFRWRIMASLEPVGDKGGGFVNSNLQKLLGESGLSHRKFL